MMIRSWNFLYKEESSMAASQRIGSEHSGVNSRRFPGRVLTMPVVARQSDQSQFTTLKIYHCPIRVRTRAGLILPPAFQIGTEFTEVTEPTLLLVSPEPLAQKWVAGRGESWWEHEGCLLGRVGSRFLTIVQNWESLERAFSWALGRGCASGSAESKSGYAPEHGGRGVGATPHSRTSSSYPTRSWGESKAFRFEPGRPSSQAEFWDSHWLLRRRDISAEG